MSHNLCYTYFDIVLLTTYQSLMHTQKTLYQANK